LSALLFLIEDLFLVLLILNLFIMKGKQWVIIFLFTFIYSVNLAQAPKTIHNKRITWDELVVALATKDPQFTRSIRQESRGIPYQFL